MADLRPVSNKDGRLDRGVKLHRHMCCGRCVGMNVNDEGRKLITGFSGSRIRLAATGATIKEGSNIHGATEEERPTEACACFHQRRSATGGGGGSAQAL